MTTSKAEKTCHEIFDAFGDSLSKLASSDDEEDGDDEDHCEEDTELGMLIEDDEPHWVMGTIARLPQQYIDTFRQWQMKLDKLVQVGGGHAADFIHERDM